MTPPNFDASEYEPVEPPRLSAEELQRRRQEPDYSTEQVLDYLEELDRRRDTAAR
jgi:hypothetical protein